MASPIKYRVRHEADAYHATIEQDGKRLDTAGPFAEVEDAHAARDNASLKAALRFDKAESTNVMAFGPKKKKGKE